MNDRLELRTVRYGGAMFGKEEIDQVNGVLNNNLLIGWGESFS